MEDQDFAAGAGLREGHLAHSPPRKPSARGKERRQPSITPRKFRRFFTPRPRVSSHPSAARRALRDLTAQALNRSLLGSSPLKESLDANGSATPPAQTLRGAKRRKMHHTPDPSSPLKAPSDLDVTPLRSPRAFGNPLLSPLESCRPSQADTEPALSDSDMSEPDLPSGPRPLGRIVSLMERGLTGQLVQRQSGIMSCRSRQLLSCPVADWRMGTADFCSGPDDVHFCSSHEGSQRCIPFCVASCHTNSLVAVGDEEGVVRLLDSAASRGAAELGDTEPRGFGKIHLHFQTHGNAIIDLAFSQDDYRLATASGDQTGRVMDMMTQTPIALLDQHSASLKQVRFQPGKGGGHVLATSGRDGSIKIWDLRCRGGLVQDFTVNRTHGLQYELPRKVTQGCVVNNMFNAHAGTYRHARMQSSTPSADVTATRGEVPGRIGEVSVTALQFMPEGKEHLILSACEADASIKLWDIRNVHTSRQKTSTPVSFTAQPESHTQWRPFGISAMTLSSDGARLYAVCKDNTVYTYTTSHLIVGHAPELATKGEPPKRRNLTAQQGLGPIYGFRHDSFHATSFYVKCAIRPARDGQPELLAVGSSDGCAILFPTDERYLQSSAAQEVPQAPPNLFSPLAFPSLPPPLAAPRSSQARPSLSRTNSLSNLNARLVDTIPIYRAGTPLVRGHSREVGAMSWTDKGKLVTVGDDYLVRCWSENRPHAADLRTGGEGEGRRWASGWAEVEADWDEEEG